MQISVGFTRGAFLSACVGLMVAGLTMGQPTQPAQPETEEKQLLQSAANELANKWNHEDEEARWTKAIEADPNDAQAHFMLAYTVHTSGDLDRAIELHRSAMRFPVNRPIAMYNIGCAQALQGEADIAFKTLRRSVNLGVRDATQFKADAELESLHNDERWDQLMTTIDLFAASPPEEALHFWVGQWDCYGAVSGNLNGNNTLKLRVKNNVIHENWTASDNTTGESWNYYNAVKGTWRQIWVDDNGIALEMDADVTIDRPDGGVLFEGDQIRKDGTTVRIRMHVRPVGDGWVRQTGTDTRDDGATWNARYDLVYVPKGETFDPDALSEEEI